MTANPYPHRLSVLILLTFGLAVLAMAAANAEPDIAFFLRAERTEGRFVGAITRTGGNHGGQFYHPMFSYKAQDGSIRTFTARNGSTSQPYGPGARTRVYYDPEHPEQARLNSLAVWLPSLVLAAAGALLTGVGLILRRAFGRRN